MALVSLNKAFYSATNYIQLFKEIYIIEDFLMHLCIICVFMFDRAALGQPSSTEMFRYIFPAAGH